MKSSEIPQNGENLAENDKVGQISPILTKSRGKRWNRVKFVKIVEK